MRHFECRQLDTFLNTTFGRKYDKGVFVFREKGYSSELASYVCVCVCVCVCAHSSEMAQQNVSKANLLHIQLSIQMKSSWLQLAIN